MKTIYFVRHGETEGNTGRVFQGMHTKLNAKGIEQAKIVADRCKKLDVDAMIVSSMDRAQQTGKIISEKIGIPFETSELFIERRRPTQIEGRPTTDVEAARINKEWGYSIFDGGPRIADGENLDDLKNRAERALKYLENHSAEKILVVTHGFFLRALLAVAIFERGFSHPEFKSLIRTVWTNNTGITIFQCGVPTAENDIGDTDARWMMRVWNDHAHLG